MKKTLLITFGCSWVYGVGVNYEEGMSREDYQLNAWNPELCDEYSFRGLIKKNLNIDTKNFSLGGSSNQMQFREAKQYFFSQQFIDHKDSYDNIIVLWGITSTARNEFYSVEDKTFLNVLYNTFFDKFDPLAKSITKKNYDLIKRPNWPSWEDYNNLNLDNIDLETLKQIVISEKLHLRDMQKSTTFRHLLEHIFGKFSWDVDAAIYELSLEIKLFNSFFESSNIKFLWYDLFNHHDYKKSFKKFVDPRAEWFELKNFLQYDNKSRDILSLILKNNNSFVKDIAYHLSEWKDDNKKINMGVKKKLLNPISFHPTKLGHVEIAKVLQPEIERFV